MQTNGRMPCPDGLKEISCATSSIENHSRSGRKAIRRLIEQPPVRERLLQPVVTAGIPVPEKDEDGVTCRPAIRYSYIIDDVERQSDVIDFLLAPDGSRSQAEACLAAYPVGATRTCYVDPRDPERVTLRRGWRKEHIAAFVPLLILGLGACHTFYGTRWWLQRLKRNG